MKTFEQFFNEDWSKWWEHLEPVKSSGGGETPRVDLALTNRANMTSKDYFWWVQADFARSLERELNEAKANLESYRMECHSDYFKTTLNKLQNVLSEFKRQPGLEIQERIFEAHKIIEEALK